MSATGNASAAAAHLLAAHRGRRRFERLQAAGLALGNEDEAYRAQDMLVAGLGGTVVGHKIGLTSAAMRRLVPGIDQPCAGAVLDTRVHHSPAELPRSLLLRIGLEREVMARLDDDLPDTGTAWTRESVAPHVGSLAAAFELIDDREADYGNMTAFDLIADNSWNGGVVIGREIRDWRDLDLVGARGFLEVDGEPAGEGRGGDAMGHPLEPLAWLANHAVARGRPLRAGEFVMTGSIVPTRFLEAGERAVYRHDALGSVDLTIRSG